MVRACSDEATLDFYAGEASRYVASGKHTTSRWLNDFMRKLPAGARVLDLGCGGGRDAEAMIANGFDVHPADGCAAMAAAAEARLGRTVRVMRFEELSDDAAFDAVWANASLLHVPRDALADVLALVLRALRPGGLHFASFKAGEAPGRDALGRYFNYPSRDALLEAYARSGNWQIESIAECIGGGYEGGSVAWLAITARMPLG